MHVHATQPTNDAYFLSEALVFETPAIYSNLFKFAQEDGHAPAQFPALLEQIKNRMQKYTSKATTNTRLPDVVA